MTISDQRKHWNELHAKNTLKTYSNKPTDFAQEVIQLFPLESKVLDLGCGLGNDSFYFAQSGHDVIGIDFSEEAIKQNKEKYNSIQALTFAVSDISKPLSFSDNIFDVVYARLSLHYFTDRVTRKIFSEIGRVLKQNGLFCFLCKSIGDPICGQGTKIEKDMFELDGHIRHFFNDEYITDLLKNMFKILKVESGEENFYGKKSAYIKVIARR